MALCLCFAKCLVHNTNTCRGMNTRLQVKKQEHKWLSLQLYPSASGNEGSSGAKREAAGRLQQPDQTSPRHQGTHSSTVLQMEICLACVEYPGPGGRRVGSVGRSKGEDGCRHIEGWGWSRSECGSSITWLSGLRNSCCIVILG